MSFIKKSDAKNHLSTRRPNGIHIAPTNTSTAQALPEADRAVDETNTAGFAKDFTGDHTTARPGNDSVDSRKPRGFVAAGAATV